MVTAPELYALQETDQALDKAQSRLAEIEAELGESDEMVLAREAADEKRRVVDELRPRLSDAEWSVDEVRSKAADVEKKLYGGAVTNPKELADLDADLKSIKGQIVKREDVMLGLLVEIEEAEAQLASAQGRYSDIEADWKQQQEALLREKGQIEPQVVALHARRDLQSPSVDRSSLRLYELLRERHAGQAVARVERGMCQGCRITLPVSVLQKVRSGTDLIQCVSCERVLFVS
jgi:predicted  nucleic acid-binding Zn-ribbon protein